VNVANFCRWRLPFGGENFVKDKNFDSTAEIEDVCKKMVGGVHRSAPQYASSLARAVCNQAA
jgi:hypothetical protein